jgi:hypothetical protein
MRTVAATWPAPGAFMSTMKAGVHLQEEIER